MMIHAHAKFVSLDFINKKGKQNKVKSQRETQVYLPNPNIPFGMKNLRSALTRSDFKLSKVTEAGRGVIVPKASGLLAHTCRIQAIVYSFYTTSERTWLVALCIHESFKLT